MTNILVQPTYFGSILQYAAILQAENITFEFYDNFAKQSCRNRCYIYAANGKLLLNVPVKKNKTQKEPTAKTEISYAEDWQALHLKSLQSAYRTSPFFEFYEDDLLEIFKTKYTNLGELQQKCNEFVMDALQEERMFNQTNSYEITPENLTDYRSFVSPKLKNDTQFPAYVQVFDEKHGFIENLSILDLLFMEGPNASMYLEGLVIKND